MKKHFLLRDIPPALHRDLKVLAAVEQCTMRELILRLVAKHIEETKGVGYGR